MKVTYEPFLLRGFTLRNFTKVYNYHTRNTVSHDIARPEVQAILVPVSDSSPTPRSNRCSRNISNLKVHVRLVD